MKFEWEQSLKNKVVTLEDITYLLALVSPQIPKPTFSEIKELMSHDPTKALNLFDYLNRTICVEVLSHIGERYLPTYIHAHDSRGVGRNKIGEDEDIDVEGLSGVMGTTLQTGMSVVSNIVRSDLRGGSEGKDYLRALGQTFCQLTAQIFNHPDGGVVLHTYVNPFVEQCGILPPMESTILGVPNMLAHQASIFEASPRQIVRTNVGRNYSTHKQKR